MMSHTFIRSTKILVLAPGSVKDGMPTPRSNVVGSRRATVVVVVVVAAAVVVAAD